MKKTLYWVIGGIAVLGGIWYFFGSKIKSAFTSWMK